jgi:hypothetical protein
MAMMMTVFMATATDAENEAKGTRPDVAKTCRRGCVPSPPSSSCSSSASQHCLAALLIHLAAGNGGSEAGKGMQMKRMMKVAAA